MADVRFRVTAVSPGGGGLSEGLRSCVHSGTVVTAYSDSRLKLAAEVLDDVEDVEFLSFGDLVGQVLRMSGESQDRLVTRAQRDAMTAIACDSLAGDTLLERSSKLPGMAKLISERADELRHFGIGPNALRSVWGRVGNELAKKLETLAEILELVKDSLDVTHRETVSDRIARCLEIQSLDKGPLQQVVVIAGPEDLPDFDDWVRWLTAQGVYVDVLIEVIPGRTDLFDMSYRCMSRLGARKPKVAGDRNWFECLFTDGKSPVAPSTQIFSAPDPLSECEWIVRKCIELHESGATLSSIGVYLRDPNHYAPLLEASASRLGLPLDITRSVPLLSSGLAAVILQALKACTSDDVRHMARLGKTSYCRTGTDEFWELWNQASHLSRGGRDGWADLSAWLQQSPLELPWLKSILAWREECVSGTTRLSKWLERLRALVGESTIADSSAEGESPISPRDLRAQTVLQRSLADLAFVYDQAGHRELSLPEFVALAERIWKGESITVRSDHKGVVVCQDETAFPQFEHLFVPGMLEGNMPRRRSEDPLLNDDERAELSVLFGTRLTTSRDKSHAERDNFVRICAAANKGLVFSYPLSDNERDSIPAFYLEELKRAVNGQVVETRYPRDLIVPPESECVAEQDKAIRSALNGERHYIGVQFLTQPWAKSCVALNWDDGMTPEELGRLLTCPFQSNFIYRLALQSPLRRVGTWILLDLPGRAGLATASDRDTATKGLMFALEELLDTYSPSLEAWEIALLRSTGERFVSDWVEREFRSRDIWPRSYSASNVPLGQNGLRNDPSLNGRKLMLKGSVPGLTIVEGVSIAQFYEAAPFKGDKFQESILSSSEDFVLGVYLMCQFQRTTNGTGVEVDSTSGSRTLGVLAASRQGFRSDQASGLVTKTLSESPNAMYRSIKNRLNEALNIAAENTAKATPGSHCFHCRYGELCRVSSEFGEVESPFGGDTL